MTYVSPATASGLAVTRVDVEPSMILDVTVSCGTDLAEKVLLGELPARTLGIWRLVRSGKQFSRSKCSRQLRPVMESTHIYMLTDP